MFILGLRPVEFIIVMQRYSFFFDCANVKIYDLCVQFSATPYDCGSYDVSRIYVHLIPLAYLKYPYLKVF